jgi:DNA-binding MltR family transcriptional regulator
MVDKVENPHEPKAKEAAAHWDTVLAREFKAESDRASVILAAALLDSALETLLRAALVPTSASEDPLFEGSNAPLGTFSARIEMAYRIGLTDANFSRNLHLVRKIRNDFAHNVAGCAFSDSSVMSRLTELRRGTRLPERGMEFRGNFPDGPRGDFQLIVSWMQWLLRCLAEDIEPLGETPRLVGVYELNEAEDGDAA